MLLLLIAIVLLVLKWQGIAPVSEWSWMVPLGFFAATAIWWALADHLGISKRREMAKMEKRKADRLKQQRDSLAPRRR